VRRWLGLRCRVRGQRRGVDLRHPRRGEPSVARPGAVRGPHCGRMGGMGRAVEADIPVLLGDHRVGVSGRRRPQPKPLTTGTRPSGQGTGIRLHQPSHGSRGDRVRAIGWSRLPTRPGPRLGSHASKSPLISTGRHYSRGIRIVADRRSPPSPTITMTMPFRQFGTPSRRRCIESCALRSDRRMALA
jgi:hypothetical protein